MKVTLIIQNEKKRIRKAFPVDSVVQHIREFVFGNFEIPFTYQSIIHGGEVISDFERPLSSFEKKRFRILGFKPKKKVLKINVNDCIEYVIRFLSMEEVRILATVSRLFRKLAFLGSEFNNSRYVVCGNGKSMYDLIELSVKYSLQQPALNINDFQLPVRFNNYHYRGCKFILCSEPPLETDYVREANVSIVTCYVTRSGKCTWRRSSSEYRDKTIDLKNDKHQQKLKRFESLMKIQRTIDEETEGEEQREDDLYIQNYYGRLRRTQQRREELERLGRSDNDVDVDFSDVISTNYNKFNQFRHAHYCSKHDAVYLLFDTYVFKASPKDGTPLGFYDPDEGTKGKTFTVFKTNLSFTRDSLLLIDHRNFCHVIRKNLEVGRIIPLGNTSPANETALRLSVNCQILPLNSDLFYISKKIENTNDINVKAEEDGRYSKPERKSITKIIREIDDDQNYLLFNPTNPSYVVSSTQSSNSCSNTVRINAIFNRPITHVSQFNIFSSPTEVYDMIHGEHIKRLFVSDDLTSPNIQASQTILSLYELFEDGEILGYYCFDRPNFAISSDTRNFTRTEFKEHEGGYFKDTLVLEETALVRLMQCRSWKRLVLNEFSKKVDKQYISSFPVWSARLDSIPAKHEENDLCFGVVYGEYFVVGYLSQEGLVEVYIFGKDHERRYGKVTVEVEGQTKNVSGLVRGGVTFVNIEMEKEEEKLLKEVVVVCNTGKLVREMMYKLFSRLLSIPGKTVMPPLRLIDKRIQDGSDYCLFHRMVSMEFPNKLKNEILQLFHAGKSPLIVTRENILMYPVHHYFRTIMEDVFSKMDKKKDQMFLVPFLFLPTRQLIVNLLHKEETNCKLIIRGPEDLYDWMHDLDLKKLFTLISEGSPERYQTIFLFYVYRKEKISSEEERDDMYSLTLQSKITIISAPRLHETSEFVHSICRPVSKQFSEDLGSTSTTPYNAAFDQGDSTDLERCLLVVDSFAGSFRDHSLFGKFEYSTQSLMFFEEPLQFETTRAESFSEFECWREKWERDETWNHIIKSHSSKTHSRSRQTELSNPKKYPILMHLLDGYNGRLRLTLDCETATIQSSISSTQPARSNSVSPSNLKLYYFPDPLIRTCDIRITSLAPPSIEIGSLTNELDFVDDFENSTPPRYISVRGGSSVTLNSSFVNEELSVLRHLDRLIIGKHRYLYLHHPPVSNVDRNVGDLSDSDIMSDLLYVEDLMSHASRMLDHTKYKLRYFVSNRKKYVRIRKRYTATKPYQILMELKDFEEFIVRNGDWNKIDHFFGIHRFEKMVANDLRFVNIMDRKLDKIVEFQSVMGGQMNKELSSSLLDSLRDLVIHKARMYTVFENNWINQLFKPNSMICKSLEKRLRKLTYGYISDEMDQLRQENERLRGLSSRSMRKLKDLMDLMGRLKKKFVTIKVEKKRLEKQLTGKVKSKMERNLEKYMEKEKQVVLTEKKDQQDEDEDQDWEGLARTVYTDILGVNREWKKFMKKARRGKNISFNISQSLHNKNQEEETEGEEDEEELEELKDHQSVNSRDGRIGMGKVCVNEGGPELKIQILGKNEVEKLQSGFHEKVIRIQKVLIDKTREVEVLKMEKEEILEKVKMLEESIDQKNKELERMRNSEVSEEVISILPNHMLGFGTDRETQQQEQEWYILENIANTTNFIKKRVNILSRYENSIKRNWV